MGFAEEATVDARRASFLTADGGFNADAFGGSLIKSRLNTAAALSGIRVIPVLIPCGVVMAVRT